MSPLDRLIGSVSDDPRSPFVQVDPMRELTSKFAFLPAPEKIEIPAGWLSLLTTASRRLSSVVPTEQWGRSFCVTSVSVRDGALEMVVVGGNPSVKAVIRKVRRASMSICRECGTPAVFFHGELDPRPRCPNCLRTPSLLRDLDEVLGWRAGIDGPGGVGIRVNRIPRTLRASFRQWQQASGLDLHKIQPWDLEGWLRDLARAQKVLRRTYR